MPEDPFAEFPVLPEAEALLFPEVPEEDDFDELPDEDDFDELLPEEDDFDEPLPEEEVPDALLPEEDDADDFPPEEPEEAEDPVPDCEALPEELLPGDLRPVFPTIWVTPALAPARERSSSSRPVSSAGTEFST